METQIWCLPAWLCGGSLRKGTMASASTYVWKKAVPPALTLKLDTSVSPVCPCCLSSCCPSAGAQREWDRVSPSIALLREQPDTPEALHLTQPQSLLVFKARRYWDFSSWHWNSGLGAWHGAGIPCSTAQIYFLFFTHHIWVWDQSVLCLYPSYQFCCGFLYPQL